MAAELNARSLPGVAVEVMEITPTMQPGMTVEPAFLGETVPAIRLRVSDPDELKPTELGIHLLDVLSAEARTAGVELLRRPAWLTQLSGSSLLRDAVESGQVDVAAILAVQRDQRESIMTDLDDSLLYE